MSTSSLYEDTPTTEAAWVGAASGHPGPRDYRDAVIEMLADSEAALLERIANLEADVRIYRELAQEAIHQLHDALEQCDRLHAQHARVLEDYRRLREQTMRAAEASA